MIEPCSWKKVLVCYTWNQCYHLTSVTAVRLGGRHPHTMAALSTLSHCHTVTACCLMVHFLLAQRSQTSLLSASVCSPSKISPNCCVKMAWRLRSQIDGFLMKIMPALSSGLKHKFSPCLMVAGVRVLEVWDGESQWFSPCPVLALLSLPCKFPPDTEITLTLTAHAEKYWKFCISGTIGDLSDGESLSGHDGDSILGDPTGSLRKSKRPVRKTARARTVLSEKQLNILKTCYSANPRPDALMKVSPHSVLSSCLTCLYRSSWWRWRVSVPGSSGSGSRTNGAR